MAIYRARGVAVDVDLGRRPVRNVVDTEIVRIELGGTLDRIRYVPYP